MKKSSKKKQDWLPANEIKEKPLIIKTTRKQFEKLNFKLLHGDEISNDFKKKLWQIVGEGQNPKTFLTKEEFSGFELWLLSN